MSWVAVAGGAASLIGGLIGSDASKEAAAQQAAAANRALDVSSNEFNTITGQESPFLQSGYGSLGQLNYLLGIGAPGTAGKPGTGGLSGANGTPGAFMGTAPTAASSTGGNYGSLLDPFNLSDWQQLSPAYNFQKQQGTQGVLNGAAAGSGALSGSAQKDLIDYNQGLANTSFNNAFNQYQTQQGNIFSRLSGIANLGQSAASNTAQSGVALSGQAAQSATNVGTAQAGGTIGSANAITGGLSSAAPWLAYGGGGSNSPYAGGSYNSVMNGSGTYGAPNSYGSGYTLSDYGAEP
jgi:hypothetical protein